MLVGNLPTILVLENDYHDQSFDIVLEARALEHETVHILHVHETLDSSDNFDHLDYFLVLDGDHPAHLESESVCRNRNVEVDPMPRVLEPDKFVLQVQYFLVRKNGA